MAEVAGSVTPLSAGSGAVTSRSLRGPLERKLEQRVPKQQRQLEQTLGFFSARDAVVDTDWTTRLTVITRPKIPSHALLMLPLIKSQNHLDKRSLLLQLSVGLRLARRMQNSCSVTLHLASVLHLTLQH
ncbi:hypothetical protein F7725_009237 [Dissostichus mawsoni]|uniref:Uncharacterized protein n=1 Tax=Dissostichus mawsoni TaxID=36200 RepID=A0A7J5ZAK8_DISMA|nr:hypothetical protein F7725_009237 [Dissostichus mawsoni]